MKKNKTRLNLPEGVKILSAGDYQKLINRDGAPEPKSKMRNKKVMTSDGEKFDSQTEAKRYAELQWLIKSGKVISFERQIKFILLPSVPGLFRQKSYVADFVVNYPDGRTEVEDVKSVFTRKDRIYKLKKHLLYNIHGILIKEII